MEGDPKLASRVIKKGGLGTCHLVSLGVTMMLQGVSWGYPGNTLYCKLKKGPLNQQSTVGPRYIGNLGQHTFSRYIEVFRYSYFLKGVKGQIQLKLKKGCVKFSEK